MAFRFTEQHAMSLVTPTLYPGEQAMFRSRGFEKPWWTWFLFRFGSMFWRYYLVVATNQRILFVQHRGLFGGYKPIRSESLNYGELEKISLGWGIFTKKLRVKSTARRFSKTVILPVTYLKKNFDGAKGMVGTWQQSRLAMTGNATPILS